jgi:hypothetical protein
MATLTFQFQGIAIHMTEFSPYRIIIPSGKDPVGGYSLTPTTFPPLLGLLDGVTFTIGVGQPLSVNIDAIPHLRVLYPEMIVNPDVAKGQQPPAAAYFDFAGGAVTTTIWAHTTLYSQVVVEVDGDFALIQAQRWNTPGISTIQVPVTQSPKIFVRNVPSPPASGFDAAEYMSNFLIASNFPTGSTLTTVEAAVRKALGPLPITPDDTFPSCSNSQWP